MGSWWVGSGITGVAAGSGWDWVASGRGVKAKGPLVGGAPRVETRGEMGSGLATSGPGSGGRSDGPTSSLRPSGWSNNRSSFNRFSTLPLKSTSMQSTFGVDTASSFFIHWS